MKKESKSFKFLKLGILFFGISILLWRCNEEENLIQKEQAQQETLIKKVENVTFNSISGAVTNTIRNNHKSKSEKNIIYNYNSIVKTIDILGNTKYSILFQIKNQPKNILYNLITGIEKDESPITPYVMKYTISNLKTNKTYNFGDFNGIIEKYAYNDFF